MPRATWKGFISFGLVNIPVALFSGERRTDLQFDLLDVRDQGKIRYRRVNEETGEEVPWDQIVRAYEYSNGNYVMLEEEDFARAAVEATRTLAVDAFVDSDSIAPYHYEKPYVVVPDRGGEKSYVLLREAMKSMGKAAIAKVVIRGRQYLMALMADGNAIMAERLRFQQELIQPDAYPLPTGSLREFGVTAQELDTAERLVEAMSQDWLPEKYHDEYRRALMDWIDKKVRTGEDVTEPVEELEPQGQGEPVNIMDLLQRSLEEVRR